MSNGSMIKWVYDNITRKGAAVQVIGRKLPLNATEEKERPAPTF